MAIAGRKNEKLSLTLKQPGVIRVAQPGRRLDQCVEHGLQVEGRAADDLKYIGGGGLLLQRFTQLIQQPRILDGDDGLRRKTLHQLDLFISEGLHLGAIYDDGADELIVLEHWDCELGAGTAELNNSWFGESSRNIDVFRFCEDIGDMGRFFRAQNSANTRFRTRADERIAFPFFRQGRRYAEPRAGAHSVIIFAQKHNAILRVADLRCIFQHGIENGG